MNDNLQIRVEISIVSILDNMVLESDVLSSTLVFTLIFWIIVHMMGLLLTFVFDPHIKGCVSTSIFNII